MKTAHIGAVKGNMSPMNMSAAASVTQKEDEMINLTPHSITVRGMNGDVTYAPSGVVARVAVAEEVCGEIDGVPVISRVLGEAQGLPEEGVPCIVSAMVLSAVPGRKGVYAPDSGPTAIRENGQVVAVTRLVAA